MGNRKTNPDFLTGVPELLILRLIARKPMHGYAIVQAIKSASEGVLKFGESSIYPVLHRLEAEGVLKTERVQVGARERVVYSITAKGNKRLHESRSLWNQIANAVDLVLEGGESRERKSVA